MLLLIVCFGVVVQAKNVDIQHRSKRFAEHNNNNNNCDNVKSFFEMKNISLSQASSAKGQLYKLKIYYLFEVKNKTDHKKDAIAIVLLNHYI